jgi:hypothetical protein
MVSVDVDVDSVNVDVVKRISGVVGVVSEFEK